MDFAWWRRWEPVLDGGQAPWATVGEMRAQPGFHEALAQAMGRFLRLVDGDEEFSRTMPDFESLLLGGLVLYLDATSGLTHRRLREVAGLRGMLSGGRISALLMRMQMIGFVKAAGDHRPGTQKIYRPTPRMTGAFRVWVIAMLESIQVMAPGTQALLRPLAEPEGFGAFMAVLGKRIVDSVVEVLDEPDNERLAAITAIGARRGGSQVLYILMMAAAEAAGHFPATGPAQVSVSALAVRCRVSRTQILKILRRAEAGALIARTGAEGEVEVLPALVDSVAEVYAGIFVGMAASAHRALSGLATVEAA